MGKPERLIIPEQFLLDGIEEIIWTGICSQSSFIQ